jgi:hypothetical protein
VTGHYLRQKALDISLAHHNYCMKKQNLRKLSLVLSIILAGSFQVTSANAADSTVNSLIKRLNSKGKLWQLNPSSGTRLAIMSHQRLGLYQEPTAVIDCNLKWSGTWLFVYKNQKQGYEATYSNYFTRSPGYTFELVTDPKSNYVILLHTSMGGNQQCLNSVFRVLEPSGTD